MPVDVALGYALDIQKALYPVEIQLISWYSTITGVILQYVFIWIQFQANVRDYLLTDISIEG